MSKYSCRICDIKFPTTEYSKYKKLEQLKYDKQTRSSLVKRKVNPEINPELCNTKWFKHLLFSDIKYEEREHGKHTVWFPTVPKRWEGMCPRSMCMICFTKIGDDTTYNSTNQFTYHRRICPYKHIKYNEFIKYKEYDIDNKESLFKDDIHDTITEDEPKFTHTGEDSEDEEIEESEDEDYYDPLLERDKKNEIRYKMQELLDKNVVVL